ncbi:putative hydroxyacylglutathione hydrolase [Luteimonas sp. 9C]|uniref:hydroxyacylglutathione hydrolase n=1 Tax=Luteimonas sp. 9C TaxID=2653148 RepID=UPI0012F2C56F|nr:hydroxyacylglutathione hydrolase [Luteimonas sp. 9C]VXB70434.1 putative hydroxyacylglutathione hydrolase [Luteimonas sp. 9C]
MRLQPLPAFDDNYIWTLSDASGRAVVVDPGQAAPVLAAADAGLTPAAILLTHHHADHIGGVEALLARWPDLPVFAPDDPRIPQATVRVGDGETVGIEGWRFAVMAVPGHTRSHIAFHGHGHLFSGDTLFSLGCGRMFEGTAAQMLASLDRLAALPADTLVCCGHEYSQSNAAFARVVDPDNAALRRREQEILDMRSVSRPTLPVALASELDCNPFLRVDADAVRAAASHEAGTALTDRVDVFAALRRWKDGFRA